VLQLPDVVAEVSTLLKRLLGEKIQLEVTHDRDLGFVRADPVQLEQVLLNLAVNARDAMADNASGGVLRLMTGASPPAEVRAMKSDILPIGDYTALIVEDNGHGISRRCSARSSNRSSPPRKRARARASADGLWHRQAIGRVHLRRKRGRVRGFDLSAGPCPRSGSQPERPKPKADASGARMERRGACWSRTRTPSAPWPSGRWCGGLRGDHRQPTARKGWKRSAGTGRSTWWFPTW
jgi:two-component system cell cycle sensor histidine kinase/response regulator CckA